MTIAHNQGGPCLELERSLPSEVGAISPFVDGLMLLFRKCGCVPEAESDVEIALRAALANAIIHGNHEHPRKHVHVTCRCEPDENTNIPLSTAIVFRGLFSRCSMAFWMTVSRLSSCAIPTGLLLF